VRDRSIPVAIVGAGPYGLSAASHLRARGVETRVFGPAMSFWSEMPRGMLLRSPYVASNIADPDGTLSLDAYGAAIGRAVPVPVPLADFVGYGRWYSTRLGDERDTRLVERVEREGDRFSLTLADGEELRASRVVVAAGIERFAARPAQLGSLGPEHVSHTSEHDDLSTFAGRRVVVVGGGQSALESAALLHESGASVEVIVRAPLVRYLQTKTSWLHKMGPVTRMLYAPPDVGPAGVSQLVAAPDWFRRVPRRLQDRLGPRSIRPAGAAWLGPRLADVTISTGRSVASARALEGQVELTLDDGTSRTSDHVLLGTGYRVDIAGYPFLAPELLGQVSQVGGYPRLSSRFETSVPGLYIVGAPAAWSFGPLMRFVAGTEFVSPALTRGIVGSGSRSKPS
jgi:FAD-dependent urate hydroxylase